MANPPQQLVGPGLWQHFDTCVVDTLDPNSLIPGIDHGSSFWRTSEPALPSTGQAYRRTCCKCLSPFSFAGLLSDPLLLPDCSFSFSKAVAYANVS